MGRPRCLLLRGTPDETEPGARRVDWEQGSLRVNPHEAALLRPVMLLALIGFGLTAQASLEGHHGVFSGTPACTTVCFRALRSIRPLVLFSVSVSFSFIFTLSALPFSDVYTLSYLPGPPIRQNIGCWLFDFHLQNQIV